MTKRSAFCSRPTLEETDSTGFSRHLNQLCEELQAGAEACLDNRAFRVPSRRP